MSIKHSDGSAVHPNGGFRNSMSFVLACVGSAVGMGNIWLFPYRLGQYGGAAFLIPYFLFVALFSLVGLSAEFAIGRRSRTGTLGSYEYCWASRGKGKAGYVLGWIPLFGSLGIAIGYSVILGWVLRALLGALTGELLTAESAGFFSEMSTAFGNVPCHGAVVIIACALLIFGATKGIERVNKVLMPAFFVLFLVLAVRVFFLDGAEAGYAFLFVPKWEYLLQPDTWIMAMGQAFFSLSITGSGMIVYGSYLGADEDIPKASVNTAVFDTLAAMLAALAIMPAVFASFAGTISTILSPGAICAFTFRFTSESTYSCAMMPPPRMILDGLKIQHSVTRPVQISSIHASICSLISGLSFAANIFLPLSRAPSTFFTRLTSPVVEAHRS